MGCKKKIEPRLVPLASGVSSILPLPSAQPARTRSGQIRLIQVGSQSRRYLWLASSAENQPTAARPLPLVLVFHGDGGDAAGFHQGVPFEVASSAGALVAYPEGLGATWDLETKAGNADSEFVRALIDDLVAREGADRSKVYAAGYSSGGFLANMLACRHPDLFAAISSSAAGAPYAELEKHPNGYPKCPGQTPTAVIALHGRQDFGVDWKSGKFSSEYWAYVNGCNVQEWERTGYSECRAYRGCPLGKAVVFCDIAPLGHWVWSEAPAASWEFFQRQSKK